MKTKIIFILLCFLSLSVMGQGTITRQKKPSSVNVTPKPKPARKPKPAQKSKSAPKTTPAPKPAPEAAGYDVTFTCNVPSASLYIDGTGYGMADGSRFLKNGKHVIELEAQNYEYYSDSIYVDANHKSFSFVMKEKVKSPMKNPEPTVRERTDDSNDILNEINKLTFEDINSAHTKSAIVSARINDKTYFYATIHNHPNLAVIVSSKGAYKKFEEVVLPETFKTTDGRTLVIVGVGEKAFYKCKKIKKVVIPKSVRYIGNSAFAISGIDEVYFDKGILGIGNCAFEGNVIKNIELPEGLREIGDLAFSAYDPTILSLKLKNISRASEGILYLPKSLTKIGKHAFGMSRNNIGVWWNSLRKILCLPDFVSLENCKDFGISKEPVEEYLR